MPRLPQNTLGLSQCSGSETFLTLAQLKTFSGIWQLAGRGEWVGGGGGGWLLHKLVSKDKIGGFPLVMNLLYQKTQTCQMKIEVYKL